MFSLEHLISKKKILLHTVFEDDPKLPPSKTRALQKLNRMELEENIMQPIKRLFRNKSYLILCNSYGLSIGVLNVVGTLLNQIYLAHFEVSWSTKKLFPIDISNFSISGNSNSRENLNMLTLHTSIIQV